MMFCDQRGVIIFYGEKIQFENIKSVLKYLGVTREFSTFLWNEFQRKFNEMKQKTLSGVIHFSLNVM